MSNLEMIFIYSVKLIFHYITQLWAKILKKPCSLKIQCQAEQMIINCFSGHQLGKRKLRILKLFYYNFNTIMITRRNALRSGRHCGLNCNLIFDDGKVETAHPVDRVSDEVLVERVAGVVHRRDRQTVQLAGSGDFGSNWSSSSRVASSWTKKDQYNVISELWNYSRFCDSYKTHTVINLKAPTINE